MALVCKVHIQGNNHHSYITIPTVAAVEISAIYNRDGYVGVVVVTLYVYFVDQCHPLKILLISIKLT